MIGELHNRMHTNRKAIRHEKRKAGLMLERLAERSTVASKLSKARAFGRHSIQARRGRGLEAIEMMWGLPFGSLSSIRGDLPVSLVVLSEYAAGAVTLEGVVGLPSHITRNVVTKMAAASEQYPRGTWSTGTALTWRGIWLFAPPWRGNQSCHWLCPTARPWPVSGPGSSLPWWSSCS